MTIMEWLKTGKRKCNCSNLLLIISTVEITNQKRRHSDEITNLMCNVLLGVKYKKPIKRHVVRCSQCDKLYFASSNKRNLIKDIKETGIKWQHIHIHN